MVNLPGLTDNYFTSVWHR